MNKKAVILSLAIFSIVLATGAPLIFRSLSSFTDNSSKSKNSLPQILVSNIATVRLANLKKNEIPALNLHTTENIGLSGEKTGTSIDFGNLTSLGAQATYRGQTIRLDKIDAEEFKILTDKKNKSVAIGIINKKTLYSLNKKTPLKNLRILNSSDISAVVSNLDVFKKNPGCFDSIKAGDLLKSACPELIYKSPYNFEYFPSTRQLNITSAKSSEWEKFGIYSTSLAFTYGKVKGTFYNNNSQINNSQLLQLASASISIMGTAEISLISKPESPTDTGDSEHTGIPQPPPIFTVAIPAASSQSSSSSGFSDSSESSAARCRYRRSNGFSRCIHQKGGCTTVAGSSAGCKCPDGNIAKCYRGPDGFMKCDDCSDGTKCDFLNSAQYDSSGNPLEIPKQLPPEIDPPPACDVGCIPAGGTIVGIDYADDGTIILCKYQRCTEEDECRDPTPTGSPTASTPSPSPTGTPPTPTPSPTPTNTPTPTPTPSPTPSPSPTWRNVLASVSSSSSSDRSSSSSYSSSSKSNGNMS